MTATTFTVATAKDLHARAHQNGMAALEAAQVDAMIVGTPTTTLGTDIDFSKKTYFVEGGVCGFAWVTFPGNTSFGRAMKKAGIARAAYGGGLQVSVHAGGQSLQRKEAYGYAYADVLVAAGVAKVYCSSRMD